jgi:hypothetical protein
LLEDDLLLLVTSARNSSERLVRYTLYLVFKDRLLAFCHQRQNSIIRGRGIMSTSCPTFFEKSFLALSKNLYLDGEIDPRWDPDKGAKSYVIERSPDPPTAISWVHETVSLKSSATSQRLVSATRDWFRVAAVMSSGQSG